MNNRNTGKGNSLKAEIVLGNPHADCLGAGICRVFPRSLVREPDSKCPRIKGIFRYDSLEGLRLEMAKQDISLSMKGKYFRENIFKMEAPFYFDKRMAGLISGKHCLIISAGDYLVRETDNLIMIEFGWCSIES